MDLKQSYFAIKSPFAIIERWLNPYKYCAAVKIKNKTLAVEWTKRAEHALQQSSSVLIAEMQLYFSCVVKKRVLFHEQTELDSTRVNDKLKVAFRPVQATSCSPEEFANNFPVQQTFTSPAANKLHPSRLQLDFSRGQWQGNFSI